MPIVSIAIGKKPQYNIDSVSKTTEMSDTCIDGFIDEVGSINRRIGLKSFVSVASNSPGQGIYYWEQVNKIVFVTGGKCYLMSQTGTLVDISGTVSFNGTVTFAAGNDTETGTPWLYMADGGYPIYTTGSTCTRLTSASGSPANVTHIAWLSSRFIAMQANSRNVYITSTNIDTGVIDNTYFLSSDNPFTCEVLPDNLQAIYSDWDELYFWGSQGLEVWKDDSAAISPIDGAYAPVGLIAPYSIAIANNTAYALCTVDSGMKRAVIKMTGRVPTVVSLPIEKIINSYGTVDDAVGFLSSSSEFVLSFPSEGVTWVYNYLTDTWKQWSYWNNTTALREEFIGRFSAYAWGRLFMQSRVDGKVYHASEEYQNDDGNIIRTEYITGWIDHVSGVLKRNYWLSLKVKTGSTYSYDTAPELMLKWRNNGSLIWKQEQFINLGTAGQREFIRKLYNLGMYRSRQYSLTMTDDNDLVISGIAENVERMNV